MFIYSDDMLKILSDAIFFQGIFKNTKTWCNKWMIVSNNWMFVSSFLYTWHYQSVCWWCILNLNSICWLVKFSVKYFIFYLTFSFIYDYISLIKRFFCFQTNLYSFFVTTEKLFDMFLFFIMYLIHLYFLVNKI